MIQFLGRDGRILGDLPLSHEELIRGYRAMQRVRVFDERAVSLQRQGRLGVYAPYTGQEAAQVGPALALGEGDWLVPSYRETGAALIRGLPTCQALLYWRSDPAGWRYPDGLRIVPFYIPIATQLPHAVGIASAGRYLGEDWVALTFVGDGGSSEGDFHEALNFAAVWGTPTVFVVQNNGWAISVPTESQMKNTCIADRAAGYGIPGVTVDGNDLVAMWVVAREAVERARAGGGPTLIEAMTYRLAPHTTSDDPSRYRADEEVERWRQRDPIERLRRVLDDLGLWDAEQDAEFLRVLRVEFDEAVRCADKAPELEPQELVEHVFETMGPDQLEAWGVLRER